MDWIIFSTVVKLSRGATEVESLAWKKLPDSVLEMQHLHEVQFSQTLHNYEPFEPAAYPGQLLYFYGGLAPLLLSRLKKRQVLDRGIET